MKLQRTCLFALMGIILLSLITSAFAANDRPLIFGQNPIGTDCWGYDPLVNDPKEFDKIAESGGATCRIGVNWDQIERVRGTRDWSSIDPWVKYCIDRGINPVILINSTPTWALPTVNPTIPVPQARYAPRADCLADFDSFVFELVRRYRGRAQYYEFWNEANGYGWHWDGGFGRADEYVPLMKRAYIQVKLADPTAKMSLTGIDDNGGGAISFMQAVYDRGGRGYFDAVAEHPYSPDLIQESKLTNLRSILDNNGDNNIDIWITEMGWTANGRESQVAGWITDYFTKLVNNHPTVKIATYHTAMDFPAEDFGYGLLDRYLNPKVTWTAFKNFVKPTRPTASGITATKLSASSVRIDFSTDLAAKSLVMYGQNNLYGMVTGKEASTSTSHQITITGLTPATTYHYRVRTGAVDYGDNYSLDYTFTTDAGPVVRILTGPTVTAVTTNSATVSWTTDVPATAEVQCGRDFSYGASVTDSTLATSHTLVLQDLNPGTNYQFKVISTASGYADAAVEGTPFTTVTTSKISGHVREVSGAAIQGATVATSPGGYTVTTDIAGYYEINSIPAAVYSVTASKDGFVTNTKTGITTTMGVNTITDFNLVSTTSTISNPGFEETWVGSADHLVGKNWTLFSTGSAPKYTFDSRRRSGSYSQVFYEYGINAGLYQQCGAVPGQPYTASVWVSGYATGGTGGSMNPRFYIGIDPKGGTSPSSSDIVWSNACQSSGVWTKVSTQATAGTNGITVFLKTTSTAWPGPYCCFDDVSLVNTTGGITGTVKNISGSVISGASIVTTPGNYTVQSDANGAYAISNIPVGTYSIAASKSGYTPQTINNISVTGTGSAISNIKLVDASAPTAPTVIDDGNYTFNLSQAYASWSSNDPETGVAEYQYAVRSESGDYVVNWTSAGTNTSAFIPATLTAGTKYYIDVKARNGEGLWSTVGSSDGVTARAAMTIYEAKGLDDSAEAYVTGIVTAKFDEGGALRFYIEGADRRCGIGVATTSSVTLGDEVRVRGVMSNLNGERVITFGVPTRVQSGMTIPKPFALINRAVGGGTMGHQVAVVDDGYLNIPAVGLNNVGLLVCVWGNVTYVDPSNSYFYIDDGSGYKVDPETGIPIGIRDGSGSLCIQVASTGLSMPAVGDFAKITGISGVAWVNGNPARLIRPRSSSDLTYITPTP